jgi:ATP-dependent protease HslVU (ClpYQ) peptidase subunit
MEDLKARGSDSEVAVNLAKTWKSADYNRKKEVAMIMIHKIIISENGDTKVIWNL